MNLIKDWVNDKSKKEYCLFIEGSKTSGVANGWYVGTYKDRYEGLYFIGTIETWNYTVKNSDKVKTWKKLNTVIKHAEDVYVIGQYEHSDGDKIYICDYYRQKMKCYDGREWADCENYVDYTKD